MLTKNTTARTLNGALLNQIRLFKTADGKLVYDDPNKVLESNGKPHVFSREERDLAEALFGFSVQVVTKEDLEG